MISEKELLLLLELRKNSRKSLAQISKEMNIPISTLCDVLRRLEQKAIIKHTSLVNYSKLGYGLKVNFAIESKQKKDLKEHLINHPRVNSLYSLVNGYELYAECVFKDMKELNDFKDQVEAFEPTKIEEIVIVEELKKEEFNPE